MFVFNICLFVPLILECQLIGMMETFCIDFLGIQGQHVLPYLRLPPLQVCCKVLPFRTRNDQTAWLGPRHPAVEGYEIPRGSSGI